METTCGREKKLESTRSKKKQGQLHSSVAKRHWKCVSFDQTEMNALKEERETANIMFFLILTHLSKHHNGVSVKESDTGETLAVLE